MKIIVISDIHCDTRFLHRISSEMTSADLIVICGDIIDRVGKTCIDEIIKIIESYNKNILAVHGNWDDFDVISKLDQKGYLLHGRGVEIEGVAFFGLGGSTPLPIAMPATYKENEIFDILARGYKQIEKSKKIIAVTHIPPKKICDKTFSGKNEGSFSLKYFIEANRIDLLVCGHIHEAWGVKKTDFGIVANAGSLKDGRYLEIQIKDEITVKSKKAKRSLKEWIVDKLMEPI